MECCSDARAGRAAGRPALEVADVFRAHGDEYRRTHALSPVQQRVMGNIETCRTEVRGGKVPSYSSCCDRHCPKCQALRQARWIDGRAASGTLLELGRDEQHLGGLLGVTAVLHTWTRELDFHPHLHCVVTGGGLDGDGERWVDSRPDFLFPVRVLSRLFRGKFLAALERAYDKGVLEFAGGCADLAGADRFATLKDALYRKEWVVYAKPPFGGPGAVFEYLGRYTHRVAISNQRLISMDDRGVTFHTKDGRTATLAPDEFIRRFLMHTLPRGFTKIRHFGLLAASNVNTKLARARELLDAERPASPSEGEDELVGTWLDQMLALTGEDLSVCPRCGIGRMIRSRIRPGTTFAEHAEGSDTS